MHILNDKENMSKKVCTFFHININDQCGQLDNKKKRQSKPPFKNLNPVYLSTEEYSNHSC